jgi:hypothetical protein
MLICTSAHVNKGGAWPLDARALAGFIPDCLILAAPGEPDADVIARPWQ